MICCGTTCPLGLLLGCFAYAALTLVMPVSHVIDNRINMTSGWIVPCIIIIQHIIRSNRLFSGVAYVSCRMLVPPMPPQLLNCSIRQIGALARLPLLHNISCFLQTIVSMVDTALLLLLMLLLPPLFLILATAAFFALAIALLFVVICYIGIIILVICCRCSCWTQGFDGRLIKATSS